MILEKLSAEIQEALKQCSELAFEHGVKIYIVGGAVRDLLLGRETFDIDICTEFDAVNFANLLKDFCAIEILQIQQDLRTAKVKFKNGVILDLASTREETYPEASHLPVITNFCCPLKLDIVRRDFTVNSIAISLCGNNFGEIIDFTGGVDDLKNKKLRVLHDKSFEDDPSRIIRALKYAIRLNLDLEENTKKLMDKYLSDVSDSVCYSRIMSEIKLVFGEDNEKVLKKFYDWNLEKLFCAVKTNLYCDVDFAFEKLGISRDKFLKFLSIFLEEDKKQTEDICERLNMDNKQKKILSDYIELITVPFYEDKFNVYKKFYGKEQLSLVLYYAKTGREDVLLYKTELEKIKLEVTGDDIIAMGIEPSSVFKNILNMTMKEKLDGKLHNKSEEIAFIKEIIKNA